jgi:hypothetical protein
MRLIHTKIIAVGLYHISIRFYMHLQMLMRSAGSQVRHFKVRSRILVEQVLS